MTTHEPTPEPSGKRHVVFGTGPVGQAIIRALLARGHQVRAVNRSGRAALPPTAELSDGKRRWSHQIDHSRAAQPVELACARIGRLKLRLYIRRHVETEVTKDV